MTRMRRALTVIIAVMLAAGLLTACDRKAGDDLITDTPTGTPEPTEQEAESITPANSSVSEDELTPTPAVTAQTPEAVPTEAPTPALQIPLPDDSWPEDMKEMKDMAASELVKEIKIGWNLGNTMDATGGAGIMSEVSWGNPVTAPELITAVKEAGFNTIRIPITWQGHLGPAPDYTINTAWLTRVRQIVDYAMAEELYVIINAHHEDWYIPSYDNAEKAKEQLARVWTQIADHFQNYDEHLIFEGMNEPRLKGTSSEWNGGNEEGWDVVNQLNQVFVDAVRGTGGNNSLRHLMVTPYAASSSERAWSGFVIPEDDKVIVSIHAYTPYSFALQIQGTASWSSAKVSDTSEIDSLMNNIYNEFIAGGIPVIIGEFGAMNKNDNEDARADWAEYYVSRAAEKGIPCIWWDNGAFLGGGELFGLINRFTLTWQFPGIVDALMRGIK